MGFPRFYWYPSEGYIAPWTSSDGAVIKVDIDEPISDLQLAMQRTVNDSITYSMKKHRRHFKPYIEVRVVLERFNDDALARELYSMESHLQKGNHVAFTADRTKTWASWCGLVSSALGIEVIAQGDSSFDIWGSPMSGSNGYSNLFKHWEAAGTVETGDVIQLDGTLPNFHHEELVVNSATSLGATDRDNRVTVDATHSGHVRYNYVSGSVIRWRDFWPYLCLPANAIGKPILTHDHRISYTFDCTFAYYPGWQGVSMRVIDPPGDHDMGLQARDRDDAWGLDHHGGFTLGDAMGVGDSYSESVVGVHLPDWRD